MYRTHVADERGLDMAQLLTRRDGVRHPLDRPGVRMVAGPGGALTPGGHAGRGALGVHMAFQGVPQLLAAQRADSVFPPGVWTGCGRPLRGPTMAVSVTSPSVSHVVTAPVAISAEPPTSAGCPGDEREKAVMSELGASAAARRHPRTLRAVG
ncbi:hypothetical protein GCM10010129_67320 [Streptomyces fumigatiscleroticus]|nr:hypothetical protein GCM10010129_67320 [Streptomyces fumigatiscleroticus]